MCFRPWDFSVAFLNSALRARKEFGEIRQRGALVCLAVQKSCQGFPISTPDRTHQTLTPGCLGVRQLLNQKTSSIATTKTMMPHVLILILIHCLNSLWAEYHVCGGRSDQGTGNAHSGRPAHRLLGPWEAGAAMPLVSLAGSPPPGSRKEVTGGP